MRTKWSPGRPNTHQTLRVVTLPVRHPMRTLRRFWPLLLMVGGVLIVLAFLVTQQLLSDRRGANVTALASAVETQNTALAQRGLPTLDPSTIVAGTGDLPVTVTLTQAPTGRPTGIPLPGPIITEPGPLVTITVTRGGVPTTVTAPAGAPVTITAPGQAPVTFTPSPGTSTVVRTVTEPAAPAITVTTTEPAPAAVTVTTTEAAPPAVTVTETQTVSATETTTATVTETTTAAPPADPEPVPSE